VFTTAVTTTVTLILEGFCESYTALITARSITIDLKSLLHHSSFAMTSKVVFQNPVPSDIEVSQSITPAPIKDIAGKPHYTCIHSTT
jgi:hypothetical protein